MNADELDALAWKASPGVGAPHEALTAFQQAMTPTRVVCLIADLRRAQEAIEQIEDFVTRHYLDTHMGRRVLALIDPATYDEGASDDK